MKNLLGIDIGGTKCAVILGTAKGQILQRSEWLSDAPRGPEAMIDDILRESRKLGPFEVAGVSIGGPLDSKQGIIHSPPNLPGWNQLPLKKQLEDALNVPVNVEHDAAACALAEYLWGSGQGAENLAYLTCGTGFGSGFIFGGKIHSGAQGNSCEVGHISLRPDGPLAFGKKGSAEGLASGTALSLLAAWRFPERWATKPPVGKELATLAQAGDADALWVVNENARAVGEVSAILADTLGLDLILLGSLARYLGTPWIEEVRRTFDSRVLPHIQTICRIEPAGLGDRLQDCSALAAATILDT